MASLTDQLPTSNSGKAIIATQVVQPSFLGGLAQSARGAYDIFQTIEQGSRQNRSEARADRAEQRAIADDELQAKKREVANATNEAAFNAMATYQFTGGQDVTSIPTTSVWSSDVDAAAQDLAKTQKAVNQGRAPQGSFNLKLEQVQSELFQKYPDFKDTIADVLQKRGFDSYVFRDIKQQAAFDEAQSMATRTSAAEAIKKAGEAGFPVNPNDPNAATAYGYKIMANEYDVKIKKDAAEWAMKQEDQDYDRWKRTREITQVELGQSLLKDFGTRFAGVNTALATLIDAAGDDTQKQAKIAEIAPQINTYYESARAQIMASVTDPEAQKGALAQLDEYKKGATNLYTGDLSHWQTQRRNLDLVKTQLGLSEAEAFPVYNYFSSVFGKDSIASLFGGDLSSTFPPEVASQIKQEVQGYKTEGARKGSEHLFILSQLMNGNRNIQDMPEEQARKQLPALIKTAQGVQTSVASGEASPADVRNWSNAYANVLIAGAELQPGQPKVDSILAASSTISTAAVRSALEKVAKNPATAEQGLSLIQGSRGTAQQLLEAAKTSGATTDSTGSQSIQFNPKTGKWYVLTDRKLYNKWASAQGRTASTNTGSFSVISAAPPATFEKFASQSDSALARKVDALNLNTSHLVETSKYDSNLPKGLTPLELANFYATGTTPSRTDSAGKPAKSPDQQFEAASNALSDSLRQGTIANSESFRGASISAGDAVSRLQNYGVPNHVAAGIVGNLAAESGLDTGAVGDGGRALSLAQWHPDRQAEARKQGYDLSDPNDAIDFVLHELKTTEPTAYKKLKETHTAEQAARVFAQYFLRPAGAETGDSNKISNIDKRISYARQFATKG